MPPRVFAAAFLAFAATLPLPAQSSPSPDEAAVLAPIHTLLHAMARFDPASIRAVALPGTSLVLMRDGEPTRMTLETFAGHFSKPSPAGIEERIHDPLVRLDNDLAVVWAPFSFYKDGKVDHCGTDLFNLVRVDGKWLIAAVADTGTTHCAAG